MLRSRTARLFQKLHHARGRLHQDSTRLSIRQASVTACLIATWLCTVGSASIALGNQENQSLNQSPNQTETQSDIPSVGSIPMNHEPMPGAITPQQRVTGSLHPVSVVEVLSPVDSASAAVYPMALSSPRDLMWALGRAIDEYREVLETEGRTYNNRERLDWIQERIAYCFDLSDIDPLFQNSKATDAAVHLRELMRRVPLPVWESLPDATDIAKLPTNEQPTWYRFHDVPIQLIKLPSGDRKGKWVVSIETRERAAEAFDRVRHVHPIAGEGDLIRPHFFEPGWIIPSGMIQGLPSWAGNRLWEQSIWQWLVAFLSALIITGGLITLYFVTCGRSKNKHSIGHRFSSLIFFMLTGLAMVWFEWFLQYHVFLHGLILEIFALAATAVMSGAFVYAILILGVLVAELIIASPRISPKGLDAAFIRIIARGISILIALLVFFQILAQVGFSPTTILAGAGVTGLAVALAAQDTLKNFLASIILLVDRPCREGDRVQIENDRGRVKSIGIRSTCLQRGDGNLVFLPNEMVANGRIENITRRPYVRCDLTVGVVYSTTCEKLTQAIEIIKEVIDELNESPPNRKPMVLFSEFGDSSLTLKCRFWQASPDYYKSLQTSHEVNLKIFERFKQEGIDFAFPTVTLNFDGDVPISLPNNSSEDETAPNE